MIAKIKEQKGISIYIILFFLLFPVISICAQNSRYLSLQLFVSNISTDVTEMKTLKSEAKMRESNSPIANVIYTLPAGTQLKTSSLSEGYYKVEYRGKTGYINEMYFQSNIPSNNRTQNYNNSNSTSKSTYRDGVEYIPADPKPSFENMLRGVNTAVFVSPSTDAERGYANYLREMGFQNIILINLTDAERMLANNEFRTNILLIFNKSEGDKYIFMFSHPYSGYLWEFSSNFSSRDFQRYNYNVEKASHETLKRAYRYKKPTYDQKYELRLAKRKTNWTKNSIIDGFKKNGLRPIEGIYENSSGATQAKYNVAVKNMNGTFRLIYLSGAINPSDWDEGEVKATLIPTATPNFYKANWIMANKTENSDFYVSFEQGIMNVSSPNSKELYVKMYPTASDNIGEVNPEQKSSGTGFALTSSGLIVTNYHVIEDAKTIKVRGINGSFDKLYSAKVLLSDKKNDLAIIKIDDSSFSNLGIIPYVINQNVASASVGSDIFVLGYPLRASMGDEIKLTNGIVSAKTGFQGDITSYQISAPVQPGNSGGPLFDKKGNIIGVINAKHTLAENASYAIKVSYLMSLINLLDLPPVLQTTSTLGTKSLSQQVESAKKFIYIIEIN